MGELKTAKLTSYVKIDFTTEAELELYMKYVERGEGFWLQFKEIGLLRWRKTEFGTKRWFRIISDLEYNEVNSFKKSKNCWRYS